MSIRMGGNRWDNFDDMLNIELSLEARQGIDPIATWSCSRRRQRRFCY